MEWCEIGPMERSSPLKGTSLMDNAVSGASS